MSKLFKTKTFWAGIVSIVTGVGQVVIGDAANGFNLILLGVMAICGRDAVQKSQK